MALSTGTLTFDLADALGVDFDARRTKVTISTNVPGDTLIDTAANQIRLGAGKVTLNSDGTGSAVIWLPGPDGNPASWQTYVTVDYADTGTRQRTVRVFGPFTITGDADLADLVDEQEVPPTYLSEVTAALDYFTDQAAASALAAEAARDAAEALIIADLGTSDGQASALIESEASQTAEALKERFTRVILHGSNANFPRGFTGGAAEWRGFVLPNNMEAFDEYTNFTPPDTTPPAAPTGLIAVGDAVGDAVLTWNASTDDTAVTGYKVYRSATSGFTPAPGNLLATVTSGLTYTDPNPLTTASYYKVTAYDARANESTGSTQSAPFNPFGLAMPIHAAAYAELETSLADNAVLTTITDRSGNGRHFGAITSAPIFNTAWAGLNSRPVYNLDGVDDSATTTAAFTAVTQPYTMILVAERTREVSGAYGLIGAITATPSTMGNIQGSSSNHIHSLNSGSDLASGRTDNKFIIIAKVGGASSSLRVNGHEVTGTSGTGTPTAVKWILGNKFGLSYFASERIAFAGFVTGSLTTDQIAALEAGASSLYGISLA